MATYVNRAQLNDLLSQNVSDETKGLIKTALIQAGLYPDSTPTLSVQIDADVGGYESTDRDPELFLETAQAGDPAVDLQVKSDGGNVFATGDGDVTLKVIREVGAPGGGDTLVGGSGDEALKVVSGNNQLRAGTGHDTLFGGAGHDTLYGGGQTLLYAGGSVGSVLYSSTKASGHDTLKSGDGADALHARAGDNLVRGGVGNDTLYGGTGHDTLISGSGNNTIIAGTGDELIKGGSGKTDVYISAVGNDTISGGADTHIHLQNTEIHHTATHNGVTTIRFLDDQHHVTQTIVSRNATIDFS